MTDALAPRDIDTLYVVRALGITAVVVNHSIDAQMGGGLNVLFLLSGMAFAQLCFGSQSQNFLKSVARFIKPLLLGSAVLCLLWFAVFQRFDPLEIGMVSNWVSARRISKFPIWYTQVLVQIMVVMVPVFLAFGLQKRFQTAPVVWSLGALALTVAMVTGSKLLIDTTPLDDKLPQLHAWNFVLGWLFWAVLRRDEPTARARLALTMLTLPLLVFVFLALGFASGETRMVFTTAGVLLLIWGANARLPYAVAQPILLISQATLFIFFLHYPFILTLRNVFERMWSEPVLDAAQILAALIGPTLIWAFVTAAQRTWRRSLRSPRPVAA